MKNNHIKSYLVNQRDEYKRDFQALSNKEEIFEGVYADLEAFDFDSYKIKLEAEIRLNLKKSWTNPKAGILKEEELYAILFEYDHFFDRDVEAYAYGIGEWKDYEVQTEEFDMGWDYDFTTDFYSTDGLTLNFFDPLEKLDEPNLPDRYKETEIHDLDGFSELISLYKLSGMIAIHEVLVKMDLADEFEALNYKNNFMFIIDEHDSGEVYPLLIKEKN
ncbi:MAG: hypothetical protein HEP71_00875 [Roseivirga sp.]|nr:hypothetical protein [Roseivirga sp.]